MQQEDGTACRLTAQKPPSHELTGPGFEANNLSREVWRRSANQPRRRATQHFARAKNHGGKDSEQCNYCERKSALEHEA
jgi:hypothetical protein